MDKSQEMILKRMPFSAFLEEECRLNLVKSMVNSGCAVIKSGVLDSKENQLYRRWLRSIVLNFIPGDEAKYDMIYDSRLKRMIEQYPYRKGGG
ncbi:MAG: hypothetical protein HQ591_11295 [candidate division Zixibacteria bacterium]|nr:hypothetical protein [Candidatus Tariuqbacter arcticus]